MELLSPGNVPISYALALLTVATYPHTRGANLVIMGPQIKWFPHISRVSHPPFLTNGVKRRR